MSPWELRLIIGLIGVIVLVLIYYFHTKSARPNDINVNSDELFHIDPDLGLESPAVKPSKTDSADTPVKSTKKIITLFLHAKDGLQFDWHQIKDAANKAGLEYGDDHLFYRYRRLGSEKKVLFLVANMLKPGVFDVDMRTSGLVFIMTLPGEMDALDLWDTLFPVAKRMEELLGGTLTDENHSTFSRQRIASMREEMRIFEANLDSEK
ncbi:cell division protein ZipA [Marinicella gelatinilytica]|uniref:cell division protein ZipA C-terminal FtsZ-binding domain-containing protein n=1 Tax=Marinicella gelatinilytica TaxID=2996017 RepID=UPI002260872F|nr:cell division protein ZipA C-terminal FtsZ-binding domain-containing protein [Marinicella gelatinilytica]MCX7545279.1 cell division protein ZipA C-terminal FtsZ-binding domain-containing protein [Marinicella gelatinilytica]